MKQRMVWLLTVLCCCYIGLLLLHENQAIAQSDFAPPSFDSPLPTPISIPLSPETTIALQYVAEHDDIGWTFDDRDAAVLGLNG